MTRTPADACATLFVWKEVLIGLFSSVSRSGEFRKNVRHRDSRRQRSHQCQAREAARNSAPHRSWVSAGSCIRPIKAIAAAANKMKVHKGIDEGLDCIVRDVTKNAWWQWCLRATGGQVFPSAGGTLAGTTCRRAPILPN